MARSPAPGKDVTAISSAAGLVLALIMRHAMQNLPFIYQQIRAARQRREARLDAAASKSQPTDCPTARVLH